MNKIQSRLRLMAAVLGGAALLLLSGAGMADPPARVARLSFFSGPVSFSPAGEDEWVLATPNRPLITGDRLWADAGGRAELQAGSMAIRLGASTNVNVLNLDDRATQLELTQGSLYVRVWRIDRGETVEIDTPNLAFTVGSVGRYRIDVDAEGNVSTIAVSAGQGEAYGEGAAYRIGAGDRYSFSGTGLRDYEYSDVGAPDAFDRWAAERDRRYDTSLSARYVSRDVIGYQDLDQYGTWSAVADYGNVWYPRSMPSGWAPYRTGRWAWIDPWGWTWIDEAPWGFAPYHYGRWAFVSGRWGWIPGPANVRPIYAPALVAFIGGGDLRLSLSVGGVASGVAWFPLGPGEVYQPAYRVSREYFTNVNVSNTRITNVNITNVYNNYTTNTTMTNVTYRNREAPGAVTAVPATAFVQSQPVARAAVQVSRELITQQPVSAVARVAPTRASVVAAPAAGAAGAAASGRPPARALQREVVARTKPPAPPPAFAARQAALAANPGRPAESAAAPAQQPAAAGGPPARNVKVVTPTQAAAPAPKEEGRRGRGQLERRAGAPGGALQGEPAAAPGSPQAAPAGPPTGQPPRGAGPTGQPAQGGEAAPRTREGGPQRPAEAGRGPATEAPAPKAMETPAPRPPERGAGRPPQTPPPSASPEAPRGTPPPSGEPVRQAPGGQGRDRSERRGPPEGGQGGQAGPAAAPPPPRPPEAVRAAPPPSGEPGPQPPGGQGRDRSERRGPPEGGQGGQAGPAAAPPPPRPPEAVRAAPPPKGEPVPQPPGGQGRERNERRGPPESGPAAAPPPAPRPPEAPRAAPPPPAPPAAQQPPPQREAPKGEQGRDRNKDKDKDQKDKDKKGSEG